MRSPGNQPQRRKVGIERLKMLFNVAVLNFLRIDKINQTFWVTYLKTHDANSSVNGEYDRAIDGTRVFHSTILRKLGASNA